MSNIEMELCPFCGARAVQPFKISQTGRPIWETGCVNYCVFMRRDSKKQLILDWNTRFRIADEESKRRM